MKILYRLIKLITVLFLGIDGSNCHTRVLPNETLIHFEKSTNLLKTNATTTYLSFVRMFFIELWMVPVKERILLLKYKNCNESELKSIIY